MIPKNIFQTYKSEILPSQKILYEAQKTWKNIPGWSYHFYDDEKGREFLKKYYNEETLHCFDILKPGAFKADLLRMCLLYIYGGIYADIKIAKLDSFDLNYVIKEKLVLTKDIRPKAIWNGFICSEKSNTYILEVIKLIIRNIKNLFRPFNILALTGPRLCHEALKNYKGEIKFFKHKVDFFFLNLVIVSNMEKYRYVYDDKNNVIIMWDVNYNENYSSKYKRWFSTREELYNLDLHAKYFKKI